MTSAAGIAGGARSRRRCRRSALKANLRPTRSTVCCFVTVTICVPFVLVLSPARPADRRAGSTTPLRSRSAIWLAMAALPVSTSHRDAGWHVADPDTDGGTAETRADERLNTVAAQQARRWAPGPPTRSEMDAGGSRLGPRAVGTSRGWDLAWLGPRVMWFQAGAPWGNPPGLSSTVAAALAGAPCLPGGRDAATLTGIANFSPSKAEKVCDAL